MKLGVIIPCYNHERYVGAAIESVLSQTRAVDRLLVIDDGSKDDSVGVIRGFEKDGVECVVQENAGAHATINRGIEMLSEDCEAIAILNSDDIFESGRFATLLPILTETEKSVVCSGLRLIDGTGAALPEDEPRGKWFRAAWEAGKDENVDLCEWLSVANFIGTTSNILARSAYLKKHPFRPYRYNHDYFFLAGAALREEIAVIPEQLLRYRVHATNTINTDPAPLMREQLRLQLDLYAEFAAEFSGNADLRTRFARFTRAGWDSISSFDAGLLQQLLAQLAARASEEDRAALAMGLEAGELNRYPNSALVEFGAGALADKFGELKRTAAELRADNSALKELTRLRSQLSQSKWIALGRIFGGGKQLAANAGKTPTEKLASLRAAMDDSSWVRLGRKFGALKA
ncbi:MAG: glycosyltransferase involved in cell wall biosynthesis [Verrucomicrobiales bacterium]